MCCNPLRMGMISSRHDVLSRTSRTGGQSNRRWGSKAIHIGHSLEDSSLRTRKTALSAEILLGSPKTSRSISERNSRKIRLRCIFRRTLDKAFRIATPMRKASWTKRFAGGWGERRGANGDGGSGGEGWREWAGGVSEKSLPMRAALEKPRPLWLEDAAQGCRNRRFRSPARQGHGTPKRGYSPRNRVRQLPQWGHRGRAAS